ncbi:MAG: nucleotidyltransferase domain-containing protein [Candidatus Latescibacterota bacterium]
MAVTPDQIRAFVEEKERRRRSNLRRLHAQACGDAARIVAVIAERYRPARIVQWGSLLDADRFREYSDIDLAVEGVVGAERFFALLHDAEAETRFPLDIVQLEHVEPEFRALILEKGQVVYERPHEAQRAAE